jgi:hypothetical protein
MVLRKLAVAMLTELEQGQIRSETYKAIESIILHGKRLESKSEIHQQ